jgi:dihydropteroate synthase
VTRDSFSDGGRWLDPRAALDHAERLLEEGADVIDVGAASTHPDSEHVPAAEELRRLEPVVGPLLDRGTRIAVDTWQPEVLAAMSRLGGEFLNDVTALGDPRSVEAVRDGRARLVLMHSTSPEPRATRTGSLEPPAGARPDPTAVILAFFERRLRELEQAGIPRERTVLDPGMGFFLSPAPEDSTAVLRNLRRLRTLARPLLVSVSRKSFLGQLTGAEVAARGPATVTAELWAWREGADYLRTHDPRALRDAITVWTAIEGERAGGD